VVEEGLFGTFRHRKPADALFTQRQERGGGGLSWAQGDCPTPVEGLIQRLLSALKPADTLSRSDRSVVEEARRNTAPGAA